MIDRSYLPFQSARDYQDPGMQKWMGFFLSEHTSSLGDEKNRVDFSTNLNSVEKLRLLSQLYVRQLKGCFVVKAGLVVQGDTHAADGTGKRQSG